MNIFLRSSRLIVTVLYIISFSQQASAQKDKIAQIDSYLQQAHDSGLFNGNVLVADNNKVIFKKAIGYADASKETPLTTQYRFHIGSIAKEFDAVGIMMLQEQGKLSINDKALKFFPTLPSWAGKVSIKNLLQYTSGIPEVKYKTVHNDEDNWKDLQALTTLDFEPGSNYAYNNNNTFLRRRIIEKVSGLSFDQFVAQKMLKPAGIRNGIVDPSETDEIVAKSFNDDFKQDGLNAPISGWTCLNLDDFYKWAQCINNFCLINPASTREIIIPFAPDKQAGLGGGSMEGNRVLTHVHDGTTLHYRALVDTDAPKGRTIILLTNQRQRPGSVYEVAAAIKAILDGKPYNPLQKANP
ncbi:MAG: class A beta-lactamase-related serine hydrolase [Sphingobacteriaceae bacterium]|nr:MAG: class A beta-lactamase-related serine hydrolase [Sphingobacteriaceae bacterium]